MYFHRTKPNPGIICLKYQQSKQTKDIYLEIHTHIHNNIDENIYMRVRARVQSLLFEHSGKMEARENLRSSRASRENPLNWC